MYHLLEKVLGDFSQIIQKGKGKQERGEKYKKVREQHICELVKLLSSLNSTIHLTNRRFLVSSVIILPCSPSSLLGRFHMRNFWISMAGLLPQIWCDTVFVSMHCSCKGLFNHTPLRSVSVFYKQRKLRKTYSISTAKQLKVQLHLCAI